MHQLKLCYKFGFTNQKSPYASTPWPLGSKRCVMRWTAEETGFWTGIAMHQSMRFEDFASPITENNILVLFRIETICHEVNCRGDRILDRDRNAPINVFWRFCFTNHKNHYFGTLWAKIVREPKWFCRHAVGKLSAEDLILATKYDSKLIYTCKWVWGIYKIQCIQPVDIANASVREIIRVWWRCRSR